MSIVFGYLEGLGEDDASGRLVRRIGRLGCRHRVRRRLTPAGLERAQMGLQVHFEVAAVAELLVAVLARVRPLTRVQPVCGRNK